MAEYRKTFTYRRFLAILLISLGLAAAAHADFTITPSRSTGIYDVGETVTWNLRDTAAAGSSKLSYVIRKNNLIELKSGDIDLSSGQAQIETRCQEPAMLYLELKSAAGGKPTAVAAAAVAPTRLAPAAPRPSDFDEFWQAKTKWLKQIPQNPVLNPGDSGDQNVEYATIQMDHINNTHVYGQLAKPRRDGKFPALIIFQWASPPYPLQKSWVLPHAAQGWLTLNIEPHDVLPDQPRSYYDALPQPIKNYQSIGNDDRDKSYFLEMYLRDYRAVDYIASRPDWDGKTLVVMGTSMGGQQSLCVAGLHPKVTHVIVNEPAGCDTNGALHGRQAGYPNFPSDDPKIMQTALYFDVVNFAPRITAKCLVAMGFVDTIAPPAGIWTAFNQIKGPKEAVPMVDSPHNHQATPQQQQPYTQRSSEWLAALVKGEDVPEKFDDHQNMMEQLGIKTLRPGADPKNPNTFDEANANRYKDTLPDALTLKDGTRVTTPAQWSKRRAEIAEDFESEIYGRIPANIPKVTWELTSTTQSTSGATPTVTKTLVGHVDNSAFPQLSVNIEASFTAPANSSGPVPVMILFDGFRRMGRGGASTRASNFPRLRGTPWTDQAIAHGWGYGTIVPQSIQPDNNQLRTGIIGLTNKGQPRTPEQWGALRAWQWGVSRLVDYFEQNPGAMVDPKKVGIAGLSRYGKAALVTQAFDTRIAVGFVGSSGEGGAKLHRHLIGESIENLAGGEYYWMAGNLIKYGASDPEKTVGDLPVDSHELIAMCAPRPCFISYGTVQGGDPLWVDARGSFMAGILASPVYELLSAKGFGAKNDYLSEPLPSVGQLIGGQLAWRQHDGGHDLTPNWPAFFDWASQYISSPVKPTTQPMNRASIPTPRTDANSQLAHQQLIEKAKHGGIDVYFLGDSITRRWGCTDPQYAHFLANWKQNFYGWNAANFGWGGDTTQNILWRLENGELDGVNPKVIILLAGTNNVGTHSGDDAKANEIAAGIKSIIDVCRAKAPDATLIVMGIFPRNDNIAVMPEINSINPKIAKFADGKRIRYLNINDKLADPSGKLLGGITVDGLHLDTRGYQLWADELKPILTELLGPPATVDHAPPPTGDPSASPKANAQH